MSEKKKVIIRYIDSRLIGQHSAKPIEVSEDLANKYVERGWCKILSTLPDANPDLTDAEIDELKKKYEKDSVKHCFEDKWLDKVGFVTDSFISLDIRKYGNDCGFIVSQTSPVNFSPGKLCLNELIVLSSNLNGFSDIQRLKLNVVLFQRGIPFVFFVENHLTDNEQTRHYLLRGECLFFTHEDYLSEALEMMGETIEDRLFAIFDNDPVAFWKKINEMGRKK